jgi:hypothetical protein
VQKVTDRLGFALMASVGAAVPLILLYLMVHTRLTGYQADGFWGGAVTMAGLGCFGLYWVVHHLSEAWKAWRA